MTVKVLGIEFSNSSVLNHKLPPKLVVKENRNGSFSLSPKFNNKQSHYTSLISTESSNRKKLDLQRVANDFNKSINSEVWNEARYSVTQNRAKFFINASDQNFLNKLVNYK